MLHYSNPFYSLFAWPRVVRPPGKNTCYISHWNVVDFVIVASLLVYVRVIELFAYSKLVFNNSYTSSYDNRNIDNNLDSFNRLQIEKKIKYELLKED